MERKWKKIHFILELERIAGSMECVTQVTYLGYPAPSRTLFTPTHTYIRRRSKLVALVQVRVCMSAITPICPLIPIQRNYLFDLAFSPTDDQEDF